MLGALFTLLLMALTKSCKTKDAFTIYYQEEAAGKIQELYKLLEKDIQNEVATFGYLDSLYCEWKVEYNYQQRKSEANSSNKKKLGLLCIEYGGLNYSD